ncbi:hypothetical protein [Rhizobium tumorigenes]|uniref:SMI1/KNR4 family protein n=1 Tax=Rhizobium tumorigenes TaxID=2041385 RepID=A0AAF1K2T2_9HYPH|nr:hypothetical protein [Rhizobium tumorigenes]WFR94573.1 hypothetical protein PR017_12135 [Rhizobium tumorigenes]
MNPDYIAKFWTADFEILADPLAAGLMLPLQWLPFADCERGKRLHAFAPFAERAFARMPETRKALLEATTDVYLVKIDKDIALVVDRLVDGEVVSYKGFVPRAASRFGGTVGKFYNFIDGFCDFHSMGGLLPERDILPLGQDGNEYLTEPSASEFQSRKSHDYLHVFNSGGKGQGYVSHESTFTNAPDAMLLWVDDDEPMVGMDFWDLFDSCTAIALSDY